VAGMGLDLLIVMLIKYAPVHDISIKKNLKDFLVQPFEPRFSVEIPS